MQNLPCAKNTVCNLTCKSKAWLTHRTRVFISLSILVLLKFVLPQFCISLVCSPVGWRGNNNQCGKNVNDRWVCELLREINKEENASLMDVNVNESITIKISYQQIWPFQSTTRYFGAHNLAAALFHYPEGIYCPASIMFLWIYPACCSVAHKRLLLRNTVETDLHNNRPQQKKIRRHIHSYNTNRSHIHIHHAWRFHRCALHNKHYKCHLTIKVHQFGNITQIWGDGQGLTNFQICLSVGARL